MKRIDRIMSSALDIPENKTGGLLKHSDMISDKEIKGKAEDIVTKETDINLPATPANSVLKPLIPALKTIERKDVDSPLVAAKNMNEHIDMDSPAAPVFSPLTPLVAAKKTNEHIDMDSPAAPVFSPLTPLVAAKKTNEHIDMDSPAAPVFSPLTPLVAAKKTNEHIDMDSPAAPVFSPLTPLVAAKKTNEHIDVNSSASLVFSLLTPNDYSPLPPMSPTTLGLFENLYQSYTEKELRENTCDSPIPVGTDKTQDRDDNYSNENDDLLDVHSSTDSDYVPDTEEDSDDTILPMGNKGKTARHNYNVAESDSSDESIITGSSVQTHFAIIHDSNKNKEKRTRTESARLNVSNIPLDNDETIDNIIAIPEPCNEQSYNIDNQNEHQSSRPKRGRKRKYPEYTSKMKKERKYANLSYHVNDKLVEPKVFKDSSCCCQKQCFAKISKESRQTEFEKFVTLGSYQAQMLYILNIVKESPKQRTYTVSINKTGKRKPKQYTRTYFICDTEVCKTLFLNNFQISTKKIDICLQKKRSGGSFADKRGKVQAGWNRTSDEDVDFIKNIINGLPKYESHYRRNKTGDCQYLKLGMTVENIYSIYLEELKNKYGASRKFISLPVLKRIFYKNYNLRCKTLKKDTCNKCDTLNHQIKNTTNENVKQKLMQQKEEHQNKAESLREQLNRDITRSKTDETFECLTYDLEKTLPLPRIPTNIVFYKRQLWLYNSGIHVGSTDTGHCNVWIEGEAGRGSQEVGSCVARFIKQDLDPKVNHLVLWSDCCGGQNRNIKIVLMLKTVLNSHPDLKTITLKYLESGHSFLPNDTDFSKIEYRLKQHERIYTPQEYINIMKSCKKKNPLKVYRMSKEDFVSVNKIEKKIVNRKTFTTKGKVNWMQTKEILLKKEDTYSIYMKTYGGTFQELNIKKNVKGKAVEFSEEDFSVLWPNGKEIAQAKLDDLKSMIDLIPKDCQLFYTNLRGNNEILEDVDGIGGELDYIMEEDYEHVVEEDVETEQFSE